MEDYHELKLFFSDKVLQSIKNVLGFEPQQLSLKFKAWCVSGLGFISKVNLHGLSADKA